MDREHGGASLKDQSQKSDIEVRDAFRHAARGVIRAPNDSNSITGNRRDFGRASAPKQILAGTVSPANVNHSACKRQTKFGEIFGEPAAAS
jgi:hypothetical protein